MNYSTNFPAAPRHGMPERFQSRLGADPRLVLIPHVKDTFINATQRFLTARAPLIFQAFPRTTKT